VSVHGTSTGAGQRLSAEDIARGLGGKKSGDGWSCKCPAHDDAHESLSVSEGRNNQTLVHCHAGCSQEAVMDALRSQGLWGKADNGSKPRARKANGASGKVVASYNYKARDGKHLYYIDRYEPKGFRRRPAGDERVLYRWPELVAAGPDATLFACEGEKDADRVASLGFVATTVAHGTWEKQGVKVDVTDVAGRDVMILEDADKPGVEKARASAEALRNVAKTIRIVRLPGHEHTAEKHGKDVSDWLDEGHTADELVEACFAAPVWAPETKLPFIDISNWDNEPVPQQEWAVDYRIPLDQVALFSGEGAAGKSLIQLHLSVAHVLGREWLGMAPAHRPAMFIDAEDGEKIIHKRLHDILNHYGAKFADVDGTAKDMFQPPPPRLYLTTLAGKDALLATVDRKSGKVEPTPLYHELYQMAGDIKPVTIGIASSANVFAGNEIYRTEVQQFIALLTRVAMVAHGAVMLISHPSLTGISSGTGLSGSTQWHNAVRARAYLKKVKPKKDHDSSDDEPPDTNLRVLEFHKNQYGPISDSIFLRYQNGLFLPHRGETVDQVARRLQAEEIFISVLTKLTEQGFDLSPHSTVRGEYCAAARVANDPDAAGFRQHEMEEAQQRLLDRNELHIADVRRDGKGRKYLRPGPRPSP
jgi:RecA-family ATPase/5S rRNA maturation endonuclease (ribonuclease M5)